MRQNAHLSSLALGFLAAALCLSACGRVAQVGRVPQMTESATSAEFEAMSAPMPMDLPQRPDSAASLWSTSQNSLVADRRASTRGDILTVVIQINDEATMQNTSGRSRTSSDKVKIPSMVGLPQRVDEILPEGATMADLVDAKGSSTFKGTGNISRRDSMTLRVAATVIERLPNGVLRIEGTQEVRVNYEVRVLTVSGLSAPRISDGATRSLTTGSRARAFPMADAARSAMSSSRVMASRSPISFFLTEQRP